MWAGLGSKTLRTPKPHSIELLLAIVLLAVIRDPNYLRIEVVAIQTDISRSSYRLIPVDPKSHRRNRNGLWRAVNFGVGHTSLHPRTEPNYSQV